MGDPCVPLPNPFAVNLIRPVQKILRPSMYNERAIDGSPLFQDVNGKGEVCLYRMEQGAPVFVQCLGTIKQIYEGAVHRASLMTKEEFEALDLDKLTFLEASAIRLAAKASEGDIECFDRMFDRAVGKAKQITENKNLTVTIDDILTGVYDVETGQIVEPVKPAGNDAGNAADLAEDF